VVERCNTPLPPLHYCITRRPLQNMYPEADEVQHCLNIFHLTVIQYRRKHIVADIFRLYLLTPWCRVLLEKLTGLQLVKKFPVFLWNLKVHYRTHKRLPPVPILGQPNPVHISTSHLLEIHPNIIHPSTPRSLQWSLSLRFPHQDPIRPLSSPP
jgi:hypothetical protein